MKQRTAASLLEFERQLGLPAITGDSDTRAFVTENPLCRYFLYSDSYSHVDRIVEYINHVITRLVLHQLATKPIELPSCTRNLIVHARSWQCTSRIPAVNIKVVTNPDL